MGVNRTLRPPFFGDGLAAAAAAAAAEEEEEERSSNGEDHIPPSPPSSPPPSSSLCSIMTGVRRVFFLGLEGEGVRAVAAEEGGVERVAP
jgi:hypothetical protein